MDVLVYGDVNMTGVDFMKETKEVVLPPRSGISQRSAFSILSTHPGDLFMATPLYQGQRHYIRYNPHVPTLCIPYI